MSVYCISGANRGLGLEFVRQLASKQDNIILATVRKDGEDLTDLKAVSSPSTHVLVCDTSNLESIHHFAQEAAKVLQGQGGRKIDFLLNVAGVNFAPELGSLSIKQDALDTNMRINVVGPAKVTEFLLAKELLSGRVRILNMTSGLGSMTKSSEIKPRKCLAYSISKAGVNMLTVHQAEDLKESLGGGVVVIAVDPGWVKTRMGGDGAVLEPHESIGGMLKTLHSVTEKDNGNFFNYDGSEQAW